ncbi:hypothetical protein QEN19_001826 [Hanseniaspora menglaensis]
MFSKIVGKAQISIKNRGAISQFRHNSTFISTQKNVFVRDPKADPLNPKTWYDLDANQVLDLYFQSCSMKFFNSKVAVQSHLDFHNEDELKNLQRIAPEIGFDVQYLTKLYTNGVLSQALSEVIGDATFDERSYNQRFSDFALQEFETIREDRHYFRIKAHELPLLVEKRVNYEHRDVKEYPVKFAFNNILNDDLAEYKNGSCRMTATVKYMNLAEDVKHVVRLLAGNRYDPKTDEVHMHSKIFDSAIQNASMLKTKLQKLVEVAKENVSELKDLPIDTRHALKQSKETIHIGVKQTMAKNFPKEWVNKSEAVEPRLDPKVLLESYYNQRKHLERLQHTFADLDTSAKK